MKISSKLSSAREILKEDGIVELFYEIFEFVKRQIILILYSLRRDMMNCIESQVFLTEGKTLYPLEERHFGEWRYHDENWIRVINRWDHRSELKAGKSLTIFDNQQDFTNRISWSGNENFTVDIPSGKDDRWAYLYLDPIQHHWRNFRWEFDLFRISDYKELQFGFRYRDFYNRYRFRYQDEAFHYDIVLNGEFFNSISVHPFKLEMNKKYHIVIEVVKNQFRLIINGETLLKEYDFNKHFSHGSCAIILWEDCSDPPIVTQINKMNVVELVGR